MKKFNNIFLILAASATTFLTGCDPLGIEPTTNVFEEQFWSNPQLARAFCNQFYLWHEYGTEEANTTSEQWSDNTIGNTDRDFDAYRQDYFINRQYDELNPYGGPWGGSYANIRKCNLAIERIPTIAAITEDEVNQMMAESYAFRALYFAELEKYWGIFPIVTKTMTIFDETMVPQNSREEIFTQIFADLDKSLEYFSKFKGKVQLGQISADAVQVLKSRIALTAACAASASSKGVYDKLSGSEKTKALYKFTKHDANYYYQMAYNAAKAVLGKYQLDPDYGHLFNSSTGHTSVECIWPIMYNEKNRAGWKPSRCNHPSAKMYGGTSEFAPSFGDGRPGAYPTQELVDCYYQKDAETGEWKQWYKTSQCKKELNVTVDADGLVKGKGENYRIMYENRDKRFYSTINYDGSQYAEIPGERYRIETWIDNSEFTRTERYSALHTFYRSTEKLELSGRTDQTSTSYYVRKWTPNALNDDGTIDYRQPTISYFKVRYAEVLLNLAEAAYKLGKTTETRDMVNQIRHRAGLDDFKESTVGHDLWEEYKLQRRVEFAFEVPGFRYFDLLRWGESEGKTTIDEINDYTRGMFIFRKGVESDKIGENGYPAPKDDPDYFTPYFETRPVDQSLVYKRKFDEACYYKLPFAKTTLQTNKNFVQNPGWDNKAYSN